MNHRSFNIFFILLILAWIWADSHLHAGTAAYGLLLFIYVSVLFCGSYFIRLNFFLRSFNRVQTNEKIVALSFDDGPVEGNTALVLDILKEQKAEALFFCIGKNMEADKSLTRRIFNEGHLIGNHSYSHAPFFPLFGSHKMLEELNRTSRICQEITGVFPRLFRPPYGVTTPNLKKAVLRGSFLSIGWSVRSYDTIIRDPVKLKKRILSRLKPGAILLLHDRMEITASLLPDLISSIRSKGYEIRRLDKMTNLNPYV